MAENSSGPVTNTENTPKSSKSGQNSDPQDKNKLEKVLRPILLEDSKYEESPESLQSLMKFFECHTTPHSRVDMLIGLVFVLMLECGFVPTDYSTSDSSFEFNYRRVVAICKNPTPLQSLSNNKNYCITMILPNLQQFEVKLAFVYVSDDLIVNCFVKGIESGHFNVLLDPLYYFTSSNTNLGSVKFQHLNSLSRKIKNGIAYLSKYYILKQNGIAVPCFEDMPPEIILLIAKKLSRKDNLQLSKTSRKIMGVVRSLLRSELRKRKENATRDAAMATHTCLSSRNSV